MGPESWFHSHTPVWARPTSKARRRQSFSTVTVPQAHTGSDSSGHSFGIRLQTPGGEFSLSHAPGAGSQLWPSSHPPTQLGRRGTSKAGGSQRRSSSRQADAGGQTPWGLLPSTQITIEGRKAWQWSRAPPHSPSTPPSQTHMSAIGLHVVPLGQPSWHRWMAWFTHHATAVPAKQ